MQKLAIKGSHSGHTLVAAILDCHPNVVIDNHYGQPRTAEEMLNTSQDADKWTGNTYSFTHPDQTVPKSNVLWVGNTGDVDAPDSVIGVVRNPYAMSYSIVKKHKTEDAAKQVMWALFEQMEYMVFYEDLTEDPERSLIEISDRLSIPMTDNWLVAADELINTNLAHPTLTIDLGEFFARYAWLRRYQCES